VRRLRRDRVATCRDAGFSMAELVVAMVVLTVILLLLAMVQISALRTVTDARRLQQATAFANEAAEQMRSIPWNTLSKGMYSGFLSASGGDDLVSGSTLNLPGEAPRPLVIAPSTNDQDLGDPVRPLFDDTGSHIQRVGDPSNPGIEFTVKAYVTEASTGPSSGIVGIVVVVEWTDGRGDLTRTVIESEAYRGGVLGCGKPETQPFLAACQAFFLASAGSGTVTAEISASSVDPDPSLVVPVPLLWPVAAPEYSFLMQTASTAATMKSQQVNYADAIIQFGGHYEDDNNALTPATTYGFADPYLESNPTRLRATDDVTNGSGWVPNPTDLPISQTGAAEDRTDLTDAANPIGLNFWTRSDYGRSGTDYASMTDSCNKSGIPAGQPCARAVLNNSTDWETGSGYMEMDIAGETIRVSRRLAEGAGVGNTDEAWVARFFSAAGGSNVGCTSVSGAGCVSAGARRTMADLSVGKRLDGSGDWDGQAPDGMVILEGRDDGSCDSFTDWVLVQRGTDQKTTAPDFDRCGKLRYWSGSSYSPLNITEMTSTVVDTAPVTWTATGWVHPVTSESTDITVVATTQVQISPMYGYNPAPADPDCHTSECNVSVSGGTIVIASFYDISWTSVSSTGEYAVYVITTIVSPSAQASFTAASGG